MLQEEIAKTLIGDSLYTPEDLKQAINTVKLRIEEGKEQLEKLDNDMLQKKEVTEAVLPAYRRFKSWAEEFDTASMEQKKMIACQLFERIELGKDYQLVMPLHRAVLSKNASEWRKKILLVENNI